MQLKSLIGQDHAIKILLNSLKGERVAHAYLFLGPQGVGKGTLARAFAQALFCYNPDDGDSCENCRTCQKVKHNNHPDVHYLEPIGTALKIEQIRDLQKKAYYAPYEGNRKVFIIEQIETMTQEAANSFLRILEEPPGDTVFLLTASGSYGLLPTILSRCQSISLHKIPRQELGGVLQKVKGLEAREAGVMAALADGSIGRALALTEDPALIEERKALGQLMQNLRTEGPGAALSGAEAWDRPKEEIIPVLDILLLWFRDILIMKRLGEPGLLVNQDMEEILNREKNLYTDKALGHILETIEETKRNISMNANIRLALEVLLLKIQQQSN